MTLLVGWRDRFLGERHHGSVNARLARLHGRVLWSDRRSWPSELPGGWEAAEICRWLQSRHPRYVDLEGVDLTKWLSELPATRLSTLEAASGALLRAWVARIRATLWRAAPDDLAYLTGCIRAVAEVTVTGHELGSQGAQRYFPHISGTVYARGAAARLVRGVTSCDGVSYLLAELVAQDFETYLIRVANHRLVEVRTGGARIYLDAQAALPPFVVDGAAPVGALTVDELKLRFHCTREYDDRVLTAQAYRQVRGRIGLPALGPRRWPRGVELSPLLERVAEPTPWDDYLEARVHQLFGSRQDALVGFQRVMRANARDADAQFARVVAAASARHITADDIDRRRVKLEV